MKRVNMGMLFTSLELQAGERKNKSDGGHELKNDYF